MHVMIDIETLGTKPGAVIASIGAVEFDPYENTIGREFYAAIDIRSCQNVGLTIDAGTLLWWLDRSEVAKCATFFGMDTIHNALLGLARFINSGNDRRFIWANSPQFDCSILEAAYSKCGHLVPWNHRAHRDARTIFDLAQINFKDPEFWVNGGEPHNALDDARAQALAVAAAYRKLGLTRAG